MGVVGDFRRRHWPILVSDHIDKSAFTNARLSNEKDVGFDFRLETGTIFYKVLGR